MLFAIWLDRCSSKIETFDVAFLALAVISDKRVPLRHLIIVYVPMQTTSTRLSGIIAMVEKAGVAAELADAY